ncbi:nitrite reductase (NAD(P)H) [Methylococcaceae bacterium HT4]|nr:nitrite reductase large subunit NirB [Methyloprofundus sp.]TXK96960.1 nitrite reductase (NAD(P)H) [Methylococcaceae bacterium CS4]TXK98326.1 nitrite reductase (NAD(P)H) [Methylococcaceae bacterium CS5]TXL04264.1 nitrite reductase (NAD(P)H) [Methylococcaceae bacterium CS3]TXL05969.1 nitrite reductase (NAD(P)H) [Methylococcaceae bacterium CS1]TXL10533.1 nitrite reductase (NAD(P)H) [Methylococcaceae bacterium CS2]TXL13049.1 nitrite reductase (NAD(P)H) [Methylococcaceae bacterium HT4]TXL18759
MSKKQTLVVIGNGMVGHNFLENLVASDIKDTFDIVTFCEEERPAYDRVHLTEFFSGKTAEELSMVTEGFFDNNNIKIHLGDKAVAINKTNKFVTSAKGVEISYDKLILATGSYAFVPPVQGHDRENCFVYRTIEDLEALTAAAKNAKVGAVVGGGLLGLEAAKALKDLDLKTNVIQFSPRLMSAQLDTGGANMLASKIEALGISVLPSKNTQKIVDGDECKHKMLFADGTELETDIILFSAGIRPRDEIARQAKLEVGSRGGIVIDNQCKTSDPDIYAIGECAVWNGQTFGLVAPGYHMGRTVVADLAGQEASFTGADMSTKLKLNGVDVASIGDAHANSQGALIYTYQNGADELYKRLVVSEDKKKLLGAVLVGDASGYGALSQYYLNAIDLPEHPDSLILPSRSDESVGLGPDALPESAQICSCFDVTKGQICSAVENGCHTMPALKDATKAATGCGGCTALLKSVLDCELEKSGFEVNTDICEHFAYTRQDLYNLMMVGEIKTFNDFLTQHGSGRGCEVCRQAIGSILASYWNEYVLAQGQLSVQDTNDTFLANMQKDGTYSVVPRMTGGEVTPEGLIAIGQIAKKYKLYTKVTGGQRVDLFGARVDQLPLIWKELIDAGFESGHAYGKSLRTVKSCVGSTWCRFGVDDSVGLAVELENRYKGLRSPHKIKFAVSGCTRECAEAQGKDIGVIATEGGWNLYVCGNGGMKPRHADLFATDLDKETLIKYIDRVLIFYIRTADRLQRTSVWMENMEGGLDYLKSVVIEDKLGVCDDLENHMQQVVDTYQCEWKTTIEDEDKLKRFRHFVNSDKTDENIVFVEERGQIRPANEDERQHFALVEEV